MIWEAIVTVGTDAALFSHARILPLQFQRTPTEAIRLGIATTNRGPEASMEWRPFIVTPTTLGPKGPFVLSYQLRHFGL